MSGKATNVGEAGVSCFFLVAEGKLSTFREKFCFADKTRSPHANRRLKLSTFRQKFCFADKPLLAACHPPP